MAGGRKVEILLFSTYLAAMALNIKSPEVEALVEEVSALTGESKTEAVRRALAERRDRLALQAAHPKRGSSFLRYLEEEVWPKAPAGQLGRRLSRAEEDEILGYGSEGV
jgi:antitoxin VapB